MLTKLKILVVEDEIIVARDIQLQLTQLGYEVVAHTARGEEAVLLAESLRPDLVLMDIQLAGTMDGITAARLIGSKFSIPIVFLTAYSSDETIAQAKLSDPFGYILKPFSERELSIVIETAIHKKKMDVVLQEQTAELIQINSELTNYKFTLDQHAIFAMTDLKGRITYVNNKFCEISGYSRKELYGQDHRIINSGVHPKSFFQDLWTSILSGSVWQGDICNRSKEGNLYWVQSTIIPLLDTNGKTYAFAAIRTDITSLKFAEDALRKSQEFSLSILNSVSSAIAVLDDSGVIVAVNKPWLNFATENGNNNSDPARNTQVGANYLHICRASSFDGTSPNAEEVYLGISAVIAGEIPSFDLEYPCHSPDQKHWFHLSATRLDGSQKGVVVSHTNITERKLAEDARRHSQERFKAIFDHAEVGMFETTPEGIITRANPHLASLFNIPVNAIVGSHWSEFTVLFKNRPGPIPDRPVEIQFVQQDLSTFWGHLKSTYETDDSGQPLGQICILQDISAQVEARDTLLRFTSELEAKVEERTTELAVRNREVQALLQAIPDMVLKIRSDGSILYVQHAQENSGLSPLSFKETQENQAFCPPNLVQTALEIGRTAIVENCTLTRETEIAINGNIVALELRITPIGGNEFVTFIRDITEQKAREGEIVAKLEMARQMSEMKTRFISMTSHEFRTPMTAIMGAVDILSNHLDRLTPEKRLSLFDRINVSLARMTEMLDSILMLNRFDAKRETIQLEMVDLNKLVHDLVEDSRLGDNGQHHFEITSNLPATPFQTDPKMIHHIVSNLLNNAIRYSPAQTKISVAARFDGPDFVITVADKGIGIPKADLNRIFDSFERGSNVGTIKGTGLGLNIVKRLTEMLKGTVKVSRGQGGGSEFTVTLPPITEEDIRDT